MFDVVIDIYPINNYTIKQISAIHCKWGDWVIGECSETCGNGRRNNSRIKLVVEDHGGNCTGHSFHMEDCNTQKCPGKCGHCTYLKSSREIFYITYQKTSST